MKNARAKRAKILFFIVKYANLCGFCCRRRRGCLSSLICFRKRRFSKFKSVFLHAAAKEKRENAENMSTTFEVVGGFAENRNH